jgi:YVTN family beta-propeller protein
VVDLASAPPKVRRTLKVGREPSAIAELGGDLAVANSGSNDMTFLVDTQGDGAYELSASPKVGTRPAGVAFNMTDPNNFRIYVANAGDNTVSVLAGVIRPISVGKSPTGIAVSSDGGRAYVANFGANTVSVIDIPANQATNRVGEREIQTVPVGSGPTGVAVSQDGTRAYVTNLNDGTVSVIDSATYQVVGTVPVGKGPSGIVWGPKQ